MPHFLLPPLHVSLALSAPPTWCTFTPSFSPRLRFHCDFAIIWTRLVCALHTSCVRARLESFCVYATHRSAAHLPRCVKKERRKKEEEKREGTFFCALFYGSAPLLRLRFCVFLVLARHCPFLLRFGFEQARTALHLPLVWTCARIRCCYVLHYSFRCLHSVFVCLCACTVWCASFAPSHCSHCVLLTFHRFLPRFACTLHFCGAFVRFLPAFCARFTGCSFSHRHFAPLFVRCVFVLRTFSGVYLNREQSRRRSFLRLHSCLERLRCHLPLCRPCRRALVHRLHCTAFYRR